MLQTQTVVTSSAMTGYKTGAGTRRKILLALLASEPQTINGLARTVGLNVSNVYRHLQRMKRDGLVDVQAGARGTPGRVTLTTAGREAAKLL